MLRDFFVVGMQATVPSFTGFALNTLAVHSQANMWDDATNVKRIVCSLCDANIFTVNHYCQLLFYFPCAAEASTFLFSFCFCFHSFLQLFFCYFHSIRFVSYFFATFFYFSLFLILTLSLSLYQCSCACSISISFFFLLCAMFLLILWVYMCYFLHFLHFII